MTRLLAAVTTALTLGLSSPAHALPEVDWQSYLKKDLVTETEGQYTYSATEICELKAPGKDPRNIQIGWTASAPTTVMSRDAFMALTSNYNAVILLSFSIGMDIDIRQLKKQMSCRPMAQPIGEVDLKVRYTYAAGGMQLAFTNTASGKTNRTTLTWDQAFH